MSKEVTWTLSPPLAGKVTLHRAHSSRGSDPSPIITLIDYTGDDAAIRALAQSYLDKEDEDWTFSDPEDIKRLARAVLSK